MWFVHAKRGPFKTKEEACKHASSLMREHPEIYEVGVTELPVRPLRPYVEKPAA